MRSAEFSNLTCSSEVGVVTSAGLPDLLSIVNCEESGNLAEVKNQCVYHVLHQP